jgi:hypothetical protein
MSDNERNALSRRGVVSAVGIGMATAAAGPVVAQERSQRPTTSGVGLPTLEDPRSKYPRPPFRKQTQSWPGLALITGGDSGMGRAAAIAYAREH